MENNFPGDPGNSSSILVVDLDHTLLKTDLLFEQMLYLAREKPLKLMRVPLWLMKGRAFFKAQLADTVSIDPALLPYRTPVLDLIRTARERGVKTVLASGSHEKAVSRVFYHVGVFDDYLGSGETNLVGETKLAAIRQNYAGEAFSYIGDSEKDLPIWLASARAVAVNPTPFISKKITSRQIPFEEILDRGSLMALILREIRIHQWAKNILIFVPIIAGHYFLDFQAWRTALLAFLSFSFLASFVYVLNDLLDLNSDRMHSKKSERPLASGKLPIEIGFFLLPSLASLSVLFSLPLSREFSWILLLYFLINMAYSLRLKRVFALDVVILASLYTIRIIAGGLACSIPVSQWLLSFSVFFFFGLAMVKRFEEISRSEAAAQIHGRGYQTADQYPIFGLGASSSLLSVLVLVFYLDSATVANLYSHPERLWLIAPVFLYWISRIWILAFRKEIHEDPVVFAIRDKVSWIVMGVLGLILAAAI